MLPQCGKCKPHHFSTHFAMSGKGQNPPPEEDDGADEVCNICSDGGDLLVCDECPRVYHLKCVKLRRVPKGQWLCPVCLNASLQRTNQELTAELSRSIAELDYSQADTDTIDGIQVRPSTSLSTRIPDPRGASRA